MHRQNLLFLLALAACVKPEEGIDRTSITGTVKVLPRSLGEGPANENQGTAQDVGDLHYGWTVISGDIDKFGLRGDDIAPLADEEWYLFTTSTGGDVVFDITIGAPPAPPMPVDTDTGAADTDTGAPADTDTGVPDTDTGVPDTDTDVPDTDTGVPDTDTGVPDTDTGGDTGADTGAPPGPTLRIEIVDLAVLDENDKPTPVLGADGEPVSIDLEAGEYELVVPLAARGEYAIRIGGVYTDDTGAPLAYHLQVQAAHPDDADIKVGAYASGDAFELGYPLAGASVGPFEQMDDLSYEGSYEIQGGLRSVVSEDLTPEDDDPTTENTVTEKVTEVFLFAGDWLTLNSGLRAGTWYSSVPASVTIGSADAYTAEPLVLDANAPAQIGQELVEAEPNDVACDITTGFCDTSDPTKFQDLGTLSTPGFIDVLTGALTFSSTDPDWVHDIDGFRFKVPAVSQLYFTLDWPGAEVDLDILVLSAEETLDFGYYNHPETNYYGTGELQPDTEYYLAVIGYLGDPAVETDYELRLELGAP
jgi:hypothetical protein